MEDDMTDDTQATPEAQGEEQAPEVQPEQVMGYCMHLMGMLPTELGLIFSINLFAEQAWKHLGLHADRATGETKSDFPQARLAIDAINALLPLVEGRFDPHMVRDLRNLLSSLQMNYVQRYSAEPKAE
jgi:hypothetical protein